MRLFKISGSSRPPTTPRAAAAAAAAAREEGHHIIHGNVIVLIQAFMHSHCRYLLQDYDDPLTSKFGAQLLAEGADQLLYRLAIPQTIAALKPAVPFALAALSKLAWPSMHTREVATGVTITACKAALCTVTLTSVWVVSRTFLRS